MKARYLRDMVVNPAIDADPPPEKDARGRAICRKGAVVTHPDAWKLVHGGFAEPADDECKIRVSQCNAASAGVLRQIHDRITQEQREFIDELEAEEDDE